LKRVLELSVAIGVEYNCNIPTRYYLFKIKKIRKEHQTSNLLLFQNAENLKYH